MKNRYRLLVAGVVLPLVFWYNMGNRLVEDLPVHLFWFYVSIFGALPCFFVCLIWLIVIGIKKLLRLRKR